MAGNPRYLTQNRHRWCQFPSLGETITILKYGQQHPNRDVPPLRKYQGSPSPVDPSTFFLVTPSFISPNLCHSEVGVGQNRPERLSLRFSQLHPSALLRCHLVRSQICYLEKHIRSGHHYWKGKLWETSKPLVKTIKEFKNRALGLRKWRQDGKARLLRNNFQRNRAK